MQVSFRHQWLWLLLAIVFAGAMQCNAGLTSTEKALQLEPVDTKSGSTETRYTSYLAAMLSEFSCAGVESLRVDREMPSNELGVMVRFNQRYRGLDVYGAHAWLEANTKDSATYGGVDVHGIDLPAESYLADKDNQGALLNFVAPYCEDIAPIEFVVPVVYPIYDEENDTYSYTYALIALPEAWNPGRILDWDDGTVLGQLEKRNIDVHGYVFIDHKIASDADAGVEFHEDSPTDSLATVACARGWWEGPMNLEIRSDGYRGSTCTDGVSHNEWTDLSGFYSPIYIGTPLCWSRGVINPAASDGQSQVNRQDDVHNEWEGPGVELTDGERTYYRARFTGNWGYTTSTWYAFRYNHLLQSMVTGNLFPFFLIPTTQGDSMWSIWTNGHIKVHLRSDYGNNHWDQYRDVIGHEMAHVCELAIRRYGIPGGNDGDCTAEGLADFISCVLRNSNPDQYDHNIHQLVYPAPGDATGIIAWEIAPTGLTYNDYILDPDEPWEKVANGKILSAALWDFWSHYPNINNNWKEPRLILDPLIRFYGSDLSTISQCAGFLARQLDNADPISPSTLANGIQNGTSNDVGENLYQAFWVNRHIPITLEDGSDGWRYYRCANGGYPARSNSIAALGPSGSANVAQGAYGNYATWEDNGAIYLARSALGSNWVMRRIDDGYSNTPESKPTLAVQMVSGQDIVHVAWLQGQNNYFYARHIRFTFGTGNLCDLVYNDFDVPDHSLFLGSNSVAGPALAVANGDVHLISASNNGVKDWDLGQNANTAFPEAVTIAIPAVLPSFLAACAHPTDSYVYVVFEEDGRLIRVCKGPDWSSHSQRIIDLFEDSRSGAANLTVAYTPGSGTLVAAWDCLNQNTYRTEIGYTKLYLASASAELPTCDASYLSLGFCGNYRSPSLCSFSRTGSAAPAGSPAVVLAYERQRTATPVDNNPVLMVRGLKTTTPADPGTWEWKPEENIGAGRTPTIANKTTTAWCVLREVPGAQAPYNISFNNQKCSWGRDEEELEPPLSITGVDTLWTPFLLTRSIYVESGATLVIANVPNRISLCNLASTPVSSMYGAQIGVNPGGALKVIGTEDDPVIFRSVDSASAWHGITVDGGALWMEHAAMFDCELSCVSAIDALTDEEAVHLEHCTFDGSKLVPEADAVRIWGTASLPSVMAGCTIENVAEGARGLSLYGCEIKAAHLTVQNCISRNSFMQSVTGRVRGSTFQSRPADYGILFDGPETTVNFYCCTFRNLGSLGGDAALNCYPEASPSFGWEGSETGVSNVFDDSTGCILKMQSQSSVWPIIDYLGKDGGAGGRNDWYQRMDDGLYLAISGSYSPPPVYSATGQYWNDDSDLKYRFDPADDLYWDYSDVKQSPWGLCGGAESALLAGRNSGDGQLDDLDDDLTLFIAGMMEEQQERYDVAQGFYRTIVRTTADHSLRWQAMTHIVSTQRHLAPETWIPALIDSLIAVEDNVYATRVSGQRLLAGYRRDQRDYGLAAALCTALLGSGLTVDDSLHVAVDLVGIQVLSGFNTGSAAGLDAATVPAGLKVHSVPEGIALQNRLLALLSTQDGKQTAFAAPIPAQYQLYQNYPNPFNPVTEIRFDLPASAQVELKIFNTLGQLVTTLVNEAQPAGAHKVQWDGKNASGLSVSTGMYIYQLKAGNFTDTKKMLLMK